MSRSARYRSLARAGNQGGIRETCCHLCTRVRQREQAPPAKGNQAQHRFEGEISGGQALHRSVPVRIALPAAGMSTSKSRKNTKTVVWYLRQGRRITRPRVIRPQLPIKLLPPSPEVKCVATNESHAHDILPIAIVPGGDSGWQREKGMDELPQEQETEVDQRQRPARDDQVAAQRDQQQQND